MTYVISALIVVASLVAFIFVPHVIGRAIVGSNYANESPVFVWLLGLLCGVAITCVVTVMLCAITYVNGLLF